MEQIMTLFKTIVKHENLIKVPKLKNLCFFIKTQKTITYTFFCLSFMYLNSTFIAIIHYDT